MLTLYRKEVFTHHRPGTNYQNVRGLPHYFKSKHICFVSSVLLKNVSAVLFILLPSDYCLLMIILLMFLRLISSFVKHYEMALCLMGAM